MHTKNIELFDKRLRLLKVVDQIELPNLFISDFKNKDDMDINDVYNLRTELQLLFNNDKNIINRFDLFYSYLAEMDCCRNEYNHWERNIMQQDNYGGFDDSIKQKILNFEIEVDKHPEDNELKERYINLCNRSSFTENDEDTGQLVTYNYYDISKKCDKITNLFNDTKKTLIGLLKTFITISIEDN